MTSTEETLDATMQQAAARAAAYLEKIRTRRVSPDGEALSRLGELGGPFPPGGTGPEEIVELLDSVGSPATMASAGGRFFGYVFGGTVPAALAASWLVSTWDQNAGMNAGSPVGAHLDRVALGWVAEALGLPPSAGGGIVTGATMANFSALCAARHALLERAGWDAERYGLFGAPPVHVLVGEEVHVSVLKALALAGFGRERLRRVPVDNQGRIRADALPPLDSNTLICIQAGNVNTGAFDPAVEICARARQANAWVHVDGAFGLWAAASPRCRHLTEGFERADSWATDAHKWPNVGYDCGIALVREPRHLRAAMSVSAAYLTHATETEPNHFTPELSRRARGIELWAALRSMGRDGLADLIDRTCAHARRFAEGLRNAGYEILNDVCINQVLVSFGAPERTQAVIRRVQEEGVCWCGGTVWQGRTAMRISVSSWATSADDVERSLVSMLRAAEV